MPGTNVPASSLVTPGGAQGIQGLQGQIGPNNVSADPNNLASVGSDSKILVSSSKIWDMRLRSYNAAGNPNFEVDQIACGTSRSIAAGTGSLRYDRWTLTKTAATAAVSVQQMSENVVVPQTSFCVTSKFLRVTLTAQQSVLATSDILRITQSVEGCVLRELISDVTSLSLLARSSVPGSFGLSLQDSTGAYSLTKLCTIPVSGAWTLIKLPNIPVWTPSGTFPVNPGIVGYTLSIVPAAGATLTASGNDVWQGGLLYGANGQSNFLASPVNSTFDIAFVQHEPGPVCSQLMDLPFARNYADCTRYYSRSANYGQLSNTGISGYFVFLAPYGFVATTTNGLFGHNPFPVRMAKVPSVLGYNPDNGTVNSAKWYNATISGPITITSIGANETATGFINLSSTGTYAGPLTAIAHYTADTGW